MLAEKPVALTDLLLDPNNPRFVADFKGSAHVPDAEVVSRQEATLCRFSKVKSAHSEDEDEEDVTYVGDLYASMLQVGFIPIDRVVVRQLQGSDKYLVIEGNRRVSAAKLLMRDYESQQGLTPNERRHLKSEGLLESLRTIRCMILPTKGASDSEVADKVAVILGLRHHGALLGWRPLPRAFNIYTEYMGELPPGTAFTVDGAKESGVAARLSLETGDVRKALKTYIAFRQLRDRVSAVKDDHFSLVEYAVTDRNLMSGYFAIDGDTYKLKEASLEKMERLCQFAKRDAMPAGKKPIVKRPQDFTQLGRLYRAGRKAEHEQTKRYVDDLLRRVEDEDDDLTIEAALDNLTDFLNRTEWVAAVTRLLDKCNAELRLEDYSGTGNDRGYKDALKATIQPLRKILGV